MSMSTDNVAEVLTQEVVTEAPATDAAEAVESGTQETPAAAQAPQVSAETVSKARDMGWVPQEEWRGSPDAWRPADQFLKRGEEVLPIVRSNLERERRKVADLERSMKEQIAALQADHDMRFKRMEGMNRIALDKQREQRWEHFEEKKRSAVADGNMQAYDKYNSEQRQALTEFNTDTEFEEPAPAAKPAEQPRVVEVHPAVKTWVKDNDWFLADKEMAKFAQDYHGSLRNFEPDLSIEENLARTVAATKREFPHKAHKFAGGAGPNTNGNGAAPHAPGVEGGGRQAQVSGSRARGWNDLPPEAKTSGEKFIKQDGLFLPNGTDPDAASEADIKKARDAYAKDYWSIA